MKRCSTCRVVKPKGDFYNKQNNCKNCSKKAATAWRIMNREKYNEHLSNFARKNPNYICPSSLNNPDYQREYYSKNKDRLLKIKREKYDPIKHLAYNILRLAIVAGKIVPPKSCENCSKEGKRLIGHHEDYNKPLEVIWLCKSCHMRLRHGIYKTMSNKVFPEPGA